MDCAELDPRLPAGHGLCLTLDAKARKPCSEVVPSIGLGAFADVVIWITNVVEVGEEVAPLSTNFFVARQDEVGRKNCLVVGQLGFEEREELFRQLQLLDRVLRMDQSACQHQRMYATHVKFAQIRTELGPAERDS